MACRAVVVDRILKILQTSFFTKISRFSSHLPCKVIEEANSGCDFNCKFEASHRYNAFTVKICTWRWRRLWTYQEATKAQLKAKKDISFSPIWMLNFLT